MISLALIRSLARLVRIEHSVFALPFAYLGLFLAERGWPGWRPFLLVTAAMVAVRSFAMAVNRVADLEQDRLNPRTRNRPLVTGEVSLRQVRWLIAGSAAVFVLACAGMNGLCLALSPVALAVAGFYSYAKRFTVLCHFVLGLVLGMAPVGGWLAVDPVLTLPALLFCAGVTAWVAGFDILYALQDESFDREHGLHSLPARYGASAALRISSLCRASAALGFLLAGWSAGLAWPYFTVWAAAAGLLVWEGRLLAPGDLRRLSMAFFTLNGLVSVVLLAGALASLALE